MIFRIIIQSVGLVISIFLCGLFISVIPVYSPVCDELYFDPGIAPLLIALVSMSISCVILYNVLISCKVKKGRMFMQIVYVLSALIMAGYLLLDLTINGC